MAAMMGVRRSRAPLQKQQSLNLVEQHLHNAKPDLFKSIATRAFEEFDAAMRKAGYEIVRAISSLGESPQGAVYEVQRMSGSSARSRYACKWLQNPDKPYASRRLRETRAMSMLPKHPNICGLESSGSLGRDEYLLCELCPSSLHQFLLDRMLGSLMLNNKVAGSIGLQLFTGLAVVHGCLLRHKNIHPGNVFLAVHDDTGEVSVKIGDFGMAEPAERRFESDPNSNPRSAYLLAPELLESKTLPFEYPQDVWSAAAVFLLALLPPGVAPSWKSPLIIDFLLNLHQRDTAVCDLITKTYGETIWAVLSSTVFESDPARRLSARSIVSLLSPIYGTSKEEQSIASGPILASSDALVLASLRVASSRRLAKSTDAKTFKDYAFACVEFYGKDEFLQSTLFQLYHSSVLFALPALQEIVSDAALSNNADFPWSSLDAMESEALSLLANVEQYADAADQMSLSNIRALIQLERVKALKLAGKANDAKALANALIAQLETSATAARTQGKRLISFQQIRNAAIIFNAAFVSLPVLEAGPAGPAGRHMLDLIETGRQDLAAFCAKDFMPIRWRDEWALDFERVKVLQTVLEWDEALQLCRSLCDSAIDASEWVMQARALHLRFVVLQQMLTQESRAELEGFVDVQLPESLEEIAMQLLMLYAENMKGIRNEAFGAMNCRQHCHDVRDYAVGSKIVELQTVADQVWTTCQQVMSSSVI